MDIGPNQALTSKGYLLDLGHEVTLRSLGQVQFQLYPGGPICDTVSIKILPNANGTSALIPFFANLRFVPYEDLHAHECYVVQAQRVCKSIITTLERDGDPVTPQWWSDTFYSAIHPFPRATFENTQP